MNILPFPDAASGATIFQPHQKLRIGIWNVMPCNERAAVEKMFIDRLAQSGHAHEIIWLHPFANDESWTPSTASEYSKPSAETYQSLDLLIRTGANVTCFADNVMQYRRDEDNKFLQPLRDTYAFKGPSLNFCWAAGQMIADMTGQTFHDYLLPQDAQGGREKLSGNGEYVVTETGRELGLGDRAYFPVSRRYQIGLAELEKLEKAGLPADAIAISGDGRDVAGIKIGDMILSNVHFEYGKDRLPYEHKRDAGKPKVASSLRAAFIPAASVELYGDRADRDSQALFNGILDKVVVRAFAPTVEMDKPKIQIKAYT